jgi:hypothetical protein
MPVDGDEPITTEELRMRMSEEEIRLYDPNKTVIGRYTREELNRYLDLVASGEKIPEEYKPLDDIFSGVDPDKIGDIILLAKLEGYVKIGIPVEQRVKEG